MKAAVPKVLVPLAEGFEEIEAVSIIDVLRRGGAMVVVASLGTQTEVQGAHGIALRADAALHDVAGSTFDLVILPGGEPGTTNLAANAELATVLASQSAAGRPVAAICAAPRVLAAQGLLRNIAATSHPSVADAVRSGGADYQAQRRVVASGPVLTSRGPGTAIEFALEALALVGRGERAAELRREMFVLTETAG